MLYHINDGCSETLHIFDLLALHSQMSRITYTSETLNFISNKVYTTNVGCLFSHSFSDLLKPKYHMRKLWKVRFHKGELRLDEGQQYAIFCIEYYTNIHLSQCILPGMGPTPAGPYASSGAIVSITLPPT